MKKLPDYFEFPQYESTPLRTIFTAAGYDALDLLDRMLQYDPLKRPVCEQVLKHDYFINLPRPTRPERLPKDIPPPKRKAAEDDVDTGIDTIYIATLKIARKLF
jgi:cyclin-dependent kinase 7